MWQLPFSSWEIAPGEVHLWRGLCVPETVDSPFDPASAEHLLSAAECARASRLATATLRRRYLQAHALLHSLLRAYTRSQRCEIGYHANGKPYLAAPQCEPRLEFNLSHTGEMVVIALVRGHEVGVDVESMRPLDDLPSLIGAICTPDEQAHLARLGDAARVTAFYWLWTRKEAWLKLHGVGLVGDMATIEVQPLVQQGNLMDIPLADLVGDKYVGSLALIDAGEVAKMQVMDAVWQGQQV
jgi:4'-phosphopantetheinyl transferase